MIKIGPLYRVMAIVASIVLLAASALFIYRYEILQYTTEKMVRQYLPDYISVDKMVFDFRDSKIAFRGFRIMNPPGFNGKYLIEVGDMQCRYAMKGNSVLSGLEVAQPVFKDAVLYIERRADGVTNLQEMTHFLENSDRTIRTNPARGGDDLNNTVKIQSGSEPHAGQNRAGKAVSEIVKIPEEFVFKNGKVIFSDGMVKPGEYKIILENINAVLNLRMNSAYTKALYIATAGSGSLGVSRGAIRWDSKCDPTAPAITMSNRFVVSDVDVTAFLPYYDRYCPLAVRSGLFSGTLIFDFDNGSIGSTNEITLSKFSFAVKRGYENAQYLETTVPDLVKYFTSASGDIVFDFKIKGRMSDPQFYLGPISKEAVAAMALDKIAQALAKSANGQPGSEGSSTDKASDYIKILKGLMKENK